MLESIPARSFLKTCFSRPMLPATIASPRPSKLLPMIDPVICALTTSTAPARRTKNGDDQFRDVAERDVEQSADGRPGDMGHLLGRLADVFRQRDDRQDARRENPNFRRVENVPQRQRNRQEQEEGA